MRSEESRLAQNQRPFLPWEGRCDAWAFASILHPQPMQPRTLFREGRAVTLSVAEQKALWIFAHERVGLEGREVFGQRNDGDGLSDYDDISPAEFHCILQVMLGDERRPFIMDRDPRPPVWNTPVHGVRWSIRQDPADRAVFHVRAWVYAVFPYDSDLDSTDRLSPVITYDYDLFAQPSNEGFRVQGSRWTEGSRRDHPDFVTIPGAPSAVVHGSNNAELDLDWMKATL